VPDIIDITSEIPALPIKFSPQVLRNSAVLRSIARQGPNAFGGKDRDDEEGRGRPGEPKRGLDQAPNQTEPLGEGLQEHASCR
jgi:hypothetical protein